MTWQTGDPPSAGHYCIRLSYSQRPEIGHWSADRGWTDGIRKISYVVAWCALPEWEGKV